MSLIKNDFNARAVIQRLSELLGREKYVQCTLLEKFMRSQRKEKELNALIDRLEKDFSKCFER